jgi:signal-transduction protein with cAMP-binding, CBS, and nucleotidyltransferase domain
MKKTKGLSLTDWREKFRDWYKVATPEKLVAKRMRVE